MEQHKREPDGNRRKTCRRALRGCALVIARRLKLPKSVLLRAKNMESPVADWRAVYWFAAAHEATVCDASQIAAAKVLDAERQGATVWLSTGKHGAFLSEAICTQGCGGDRCTEMAPLLPLERLTEIVACPPFSLTV